MIERLETSGHKEAWPTRMPFGKHKGLPMDTLARVDPEYCRWILRNDIGDAVLRSCVAWNLIAQGHPQQWLRDELHRLLAQQPYELTETNFAPKFRALIHRRVR